MTSTISTTDGKKVSARFRARDGADITFLSSDKVYFWIHRNNLDTHSEGFSPPSSTSSPVREAVPLTETAAVLDLLFQFMYPQVQPDLQKVPFKTLAGLAEAAEKYQVYAALQLIKMHMIGAAKNHPFPVLQYAIRHGHATIVEKAASASVTHPAEDAYRDLSSSYYIAWTRYSAQWKEFLVTAWELCGALDVDMHATDEYPETDEDCFAWQEYVSAVQLNFGARPLLLKDGEMYQFFDQNVPDLNESDCEACGDSAERWEDAVEAERNNIKPFSYFLAAAGY